MNKSELVSRIAENANLTKKDTGAFLEAFMIAVTNVLSEKDEVRLLGFGTFSTTVRKASTGRNPGTNEEIQIPETIVPKFKPGQNLKDSVAKK